MSNESPPSVNPAGHSGLLGNALALISAVADFFESRLALAAKESKSAAVQILPAWHIWPGPHGHGSH